MYQVICRPEGRPWARPDDWLALAASEPLPSVRPLVLHMRENRSRLLLHERQAIAVLGTCLAALSILPALKGYWLVPVFSLTALATLVFALGRHSGSAPASETLEFGDDRIVHRRKCGQSVELLPGRIQLKAERRSPADLRLSIADRFCSIEIGTCLSLEEREAIAPIIAAALAGVRRS